MKIGYIHECSVVKYQAGRIIRPAGFPEASPLGESWGVASSLPTHARSMPEVIAGLSLPLFITPNEWIGWLSQRGFSAIGALGNDDRAGCFT